MTIRITGMNSGLDTESIIQELASARSVKVQNIEKEQTKLSWKIDAWKSLNAKIYSFYTDVLDDMRFDSAYTKKSTKISNPNAVSVVTGGNAVNGVQSLKIKQMAKAAYLTGGKIKKSDGSAAKGDTKLSEMGITGDADGKITFKLTVGGTLDKTTGIRTGGEEKEITIDANSTLADVSAAFKEQGLNANFDEGTGRFFLSAEDTGAELDFDLTAEGDSLTALQSLGLYVDPTDPMNTAKAEGQATMIHGQDALVELNGAEFTSNDNTFEINGLTITALQETGDEEITLTTSQDTDGIYDMIKNFITKYNELINEMDKLYNAENASKYQPLTKEEKDAMSETEIEEWEKKIKDSLLRRDTTLSGVSSAMKQVMLGGVNVNGKMMYLTNFGIETLGYFKSKDNEKNAYHIDGDADDSNTKNNEDKLRAAIATDPDSVIEFFKGLANGLHDKLDEKMARTDYSSAFTVYNDKQMDIELKDYTSKIKTEQDKLNDYMDKWYNKFSQMEVALSKLQSKESSISSLFG